MGSNLRIDRLRGGKPLQNRRFRERKQLSQTVARPKTLAEGWGNCGGLEPHRNTGIALRGLVGNPTTRGGGISPASASRPPGRVQCSCCGRSAACHPPLRDVVDVECSGERRVESLSACISLRPSAWALVVTLACPHPYLVAACVLFWIYRNGTPKMPSSDRPRFRPGAPTLAS
jgi:hypothetical protein